MLLLFGAGLCLNRVDVVVFLAAMTLSVMVGFLPRVKKSAAEAGEAAATDEVVFLGAIVFSTLSAGVHVVIVYCFACALDASCVGVLGPKEADGRNQTKNDVRDGRQTRGGSNSIENWWQWEE